MRRTSLHLTRLFICFAVMPAVLSIEPREKGRPDVVQQSLDFVVFCKDNFAVAGQPSGLSRIDLKTGRVVWTALSDNIVDVGPAAAGDSIAVITDSFNTIYAFSKATGKLLWHKEHHSNVLASDGQYFYVAQYEKGKIAALDSHSGSTVWDLQIPTHRKGYLTFARVNEGFLYTDWFAINLRSRKLGHQWPENPFVTAIAFPRPGETLLGDSDGNLTLYDAAFKVINRFQAGGTGISSIATSEDGILVSFQARDSSHWGSIEFLSWNGEHKWTAPGLPSDFNIFNPFTIAGNAALITVPESDSYKQWRFESRSLTTGKINWTAPQGAYGDWPVVCGNTVFIRDGDLIRGLDIADGMPRLASPSKTQQLPTTGAKSVVNR